MSANENNTGLPGANNAPPAPPAATPPSAIPNPMAGGFLDGFFGSGTTPAQPGGAPQPETMSDADRAAEAKRLAEEAEAKRVADEAEAKRVADEAEAKRVADEAEAKRVADEAEAKRVADEAEAKRVADEAEAKRVADEAAEAKRVADEAEAKRVADEAEAAKREAEAKRAQLIAERKKDEADLPNLDKTATDKEAAAQQAKTDLEAAQQASTKADELETTAKADAVAKAELLAQAEKLVADVQAKVAAKTETFKPYKERFDKLYADLQKLRDAEAVDGTDSTPATKAAVERVKTEIDFPTLVARETAVRDETPAYEAAKSELADAEKELISAQTALTTPKQADTDAKTAQTEAEAKATKAKQDLATAQETSSKATAEAEAARAAHKQLADKLVKDQQADQALLKTVDDFIAKTGDYTTKAVPGTEAAVVTAARDAMVEAYNAIDFLEADVVLERLITDSKELTEKRAKLQSSQDLVRDIANELFKVKTSKELDDAFAALNKTDAVEKMKAELAFLSLVKVVQKQYSPLVTAGAQIQAEAYALEQAKLQPATEALAQAEAEAKTAVDKAAADAATPADKDAVAPAEARVVTLKKALKEVETAIETQKQKAEAEKQLKDAFDAYQKKAQEINDVLDTLHAHEGYVKGAKANLDAAAAKLAAATEVDRATAEAESKAAITALVDLVAKPETKVLAQLIDCRIEQRQAEEQSMKAKLDAAQAKYDAAVAANATPTAEGDRLVAETLAARDAAQALHAKEVSLAGTAQQRKTDLDAAVAAAVLPVDPVVAERNARAKQLAGIDKLVAIMQNKAKVDFAEDAVKRQKTNELLDTMLALNALYIRGNLTPDQFKVEAKVAIDEAHKTLDKHDGWKQLLVNLAVFVASLALAGIPYLIAAVCNKSWKAVNVNTDSQNQLENWENETKTAIPSAAP